MNNKSRKFIFLAAGLVTPWLLSSMAFGQSQVPKYDASREIALRNHVNHGNALLSHGQIKPAIDEYQKAIEIDPKNGIARSNLALAHTQQGISYFNHHQWDEAAAEWNLALKIDPSQASAKRNMKILDITLEKMGLQLGNDEPPPGPADKGGAPDKDGATETAKGPGAAAEGATSKTTDGKGGKKVVLTTGVNGGEASPPQGYAPADVTQPAAAQPSATAPKSSAPPGQTRRAGSDAFDDGFAGGQVVPPAGATQPAIQPGASQTVAPSQAVAPSPADSTVSGASLMTQPVDNSAGAAQPAAAVNQSAPPNVQTYEYPTQPDSPGTQVFEDKDAGTTIKIMPKPTPVVEELPPQVVQPPAVIVAPPAMTVVPDTTAPPAAGGTFDEQIGALEMKVFGRKQKSMPILKRLEKLETGTSGSIGQGTVQERVDVLRRAYGP